MKLLTILFIIFFPLVVKAQVDDIKAESKQNSENSSKSSSTDSNSSGSGSGGSFFLFELVFQAVPGWQAFKLHDDRTRYPSMVSIDIMLQGGVQPANYYLLWPRIRGNWGLFSTDFRMNYLIEDDVEGYKHIRTNDWQIFQMNLITSRFLTFRVGTGIMQEAFEDRRTFNETAFYFGVHAPDQSKTIGFEYRFAKDWETGNNPRREFSAQYQHQVFQKGIMHGNISAGVVYQKYYNSIEIWCVQAGLVLRFFRPINRNNWSEN